MSWLLTASVPDILGGDQMVPPCLAVDCIRIRLNKSLDEERDKQLARKQLLEYNHISTDRTVLAHMVREYGKEETKKRIEELKLCGANRDDRYSSVMVRFGRMVDRVFEYFTVKHMRMEPFQLELFRGVVLGITKNQFGDSLFKYKHALLAKMQLTPLGSERYDYNRPSVSHARVINTLFTHYANPYTLCLAPRQCGKSLMMKLILAAVLLHLEINVMVQAQNRAMCTTLRMGVETMINEMQTLDSFTQIERIIEMCGSPDNRIYKFNGEYREPAYAHFLSSGNDVSVDLQFHFACLFSHAPLFYAWLCLLCFLHCLESLCA